MSEDDKWASLQDAWSSDALAAPPDVGAMMARARRQRRRTLLLIGAEWAVAALALAALLAQWREPAAQLLHTAWWSFVMLVTAVVLSLSTWIRLRSLREPAGGSLRDWLRLRQRRALLGLRLAALTRWTVIALSPSPLIALTMVPADPDGWRTVVAVVVPVLVLAGSWRWARRQSPRLEAELDEVRVLAAEWLGEELDSHAELDR